MTIHASKGLEFPVVILARAGGRFNKDEFKSPVIYHKDLGIGFNSYNLEERTSRPSFIKKALMYIKSNEFSAEEMRILYVAMTRAKEKLIITGVKDKSHELFENEKELGMDPGYISLKNPSDYLSWIIPALASYGDKYNIHFFSADDIAKRRDDILSAVSPVADDIAASENGIDKDVFEEIDRRFSFEYIPKTGDELPVKVSVSEIKHKAMDELETDTAESETTADFIETNDKERYVPSFISGETEENRGALRGTAMHRFMECLDFKMDVKDVDEYIAYIREKSLMTEEEISLLNKKALKMFLKSDIYDRMSLADKRMDLFKEQPFVMRMSAGEAGYSDSDGELLIQGIIDVYWTEGEKVFLLDYKTDAVNDSLELVRRYKKQLELYADALEKALKRTVDSIYIYSFRLNELIEL